MEQAITVEMIRKKYGNPTRGATDEPSESDTHYSVDGAFCLCVNVVSTFGCNWNFPSRDALIDVMEKYCEARVDRSTLNQYANAIIHYSDKGEFEQAWDKLEEFLALDATVIDEDVQALEYDDYVWFATPRTARTVEAVVLSAQRSA